MANPKYGGSKGDLDKAIAATNAAEAQSIERKAKAQGEQTAAEDRATEAETRNRGARKSSAAEIERQSAALEATTSRLASETAAINANTEAWLRNVRARGGAGAEAALGRYAGASGDLTAAVAATDAQARAVSNLDQKAQSLARTGRQLDLFGAGTSGLFGAAPANAVTGPSRLRQIDFKDPASQAKLASAFSFAGATPAGAYDATRVAAYSKAVQTEVSVEELEAAARARSNELLQRSVGAYAASSQALQRHGALTAEFIQGLVRGEVTLQEFESQLTITIGKFAGWAVAGGLVYGAYDAIKHLFTGLKETETGVSQLRRALGEKVNAPAAAEGFRKVAVETNSSIREVADAQFYSARVFHDQADSLALASTALRAYRLDQVNTQDAIKAFAAVNVAFAAGPKEIADTFDQLDVGQLKFNARLNQTLPQVGRASASFAAAGGTLKQLVDQVIQINRATGGGGGSGGGNPATALLREPANLQRAESEEVLRRYNINPKFAQRNVGAFNQLVQERAHSGQYDEHALQELAKAAGAGAGVGFRYLLPLFRLGRGDIPAEERAATEHAGGSAQEDLKHRLDQADEQVKRLGIDFEVFGSKLASIGLGPILTDSLKGLDIFARGVGLLADPLVVLGDIIGRIPAPIRDTVEALAALAAVKAVSRSDLALTARQFAGESKFFPTYAGGGASELRALQSTQRKYLEYLTNQREGQSVAQLTAGRRVQTAQGALDDLRAGGPGAFGSQQEYNDRELALRQRLVAAQGAQADAASAGDVLENEINSAKSRLLVLENRKLAIQERLVVAQEEGLYAAQFGAPNTLPLLAPRGGVARSPGGVVLPSGVASDAEAGATSVEAGAAGAATEAAAVAATSRYAAAGAAVRGAATTVGRTFTGMRAFLGNLGLLGKGIAAFVALDVLNQLDGANTEFTQGAARISALQQPSSASALRESLAKVKPNYQDAKGPGGLLEYGKAFGHDLLQIPQHPIAAIESFFGGSNPDIFSSDQREHENALAERQRKLLREGKFNNLGKNAALGPQALEAIEGQEYEQTQGLEEGQSEKTIEKVQQKIAAQLKLRLDELKSFGTGTGYGAQAVQRLTGSLNSVADHYIQGGQTIQFEELAKDSETVIQGVISSVQEHVAQAAKLATGEGERERALAQVRNRVQGTIRDLARPLIATGDEIKADEGALGTYQGQLAAIQDPSKRSALTKKIDDLRKKLGDLRNRYGQYRELYSTDAAKLQQLEEAAGQELLASAEAGLNAKAGVEKAKAGADKQAGAEGEVKNIIAREGLAKKYLKEGAAKKNALLTLEAQRIQAEEAVVTERVSTARSHGQRQIAELPVGDTIGKARDEVSIDKRVEDIIRHSNLSPKSKAKQLEEARTATLTAEKQLEETIYQEALAISNLQAQIAEARDTGNAVAQAQDALRGAQSAAGLAKTPQEKLQAQLDIINAINQARQAQQARIAGEGELAESQTSDPVKRAQDKVRTDRRLLASAVGPDERTKDQAALNNDLRSATEARVGAKEEEVEFHLKMQQISQQQAIDQYQNLLKLHGLTKKTRDDILTKIRSLQGELGNNPTYDLGPGQIKLPTAYDVHKAILSASHGTAVVHSTGDTTQVNSFEIIVHDSRDVGKVADVLDRALGSGVKARLRAAGLRGS